MAPKSEVETPDKKSGQGTAFNLYLKQEDAWVKEALEAYAEKERRSMSEVAVMAMIEFAKKHGLKPKN